MAPKIGQFMTHSPQTIGVGIEIKKVAEVMAKHNVRHLPVKKAGKLVGVISDRDIKAARSFRGPGELTAEEIMTPDPYCVTVNTPLSEVAFAMAENRYGSAIIIDDGGEVIGIFTDSDGLRVLSELLSAPSKVMAAA